MKWRQARDLGSIEGLTPKLRCSKRSAEHKEIERLRRRNERLEDQLELLAPRPLYREATWVFCNRCGYSVDTDLIHPDGHHYGDDGDFYCADCWEAAP